MFAWIHKKTSTLEMKLFLLSLVKLLAHVLVIDDGGGCGVVVNQSFTLLAISHFHRKSHMTKA